MSKNDDTILSLNPHGSYAVVVADGHLDGEPEALRRFLSFLHMVGERDLQALYILGDLFPVWLGVPRLQLSYQTLVIEAFQKLSDEGLNVIYVEGNRDYFLAPHYQGHPFTEIASDYSEAQVSRQRLYFSHGDLVNIHNDALYRFWRRFSRNRAVYTIFSCLPRCIAVPVTQAIERRFRNTNRRHKTNFPAATCKRYAQSLFSRYDTIILGHFHYQYHQTTALNGRSKSLYTLPAWKDTPVFLEISSEGECAFRYFSSE